MESDNRNIYPNMFGGVYYEGCLWGSRKRGREIINIDVLTGEVRIIDAFKRLPNGSFQFETVILHNGKLIFIPGKSNYIVIYDINSHDTWYEPYDDEGESISIKYCSYEIYNDEIFLFPIRMKHILKINLNSKTVEKIKVPFNELNEKLNRDIIFGNSIRVSKKNVILRLIDKNIYFEFDLSNSSYKWIKGIECEDEIIKIYANGKSNFIIGLGTKGRIYSICKGEWNLKLIYEAKEEYSNIEIYDNKIWMLPEYEGKIKQVYIDSQKEKLFNYDYKFEYNPVWSNQDIIRTVAKDKNKLYIIPHCTNMIVSIDLQDEILKCKKLWIKEESLTKLNNEERGIFERCIIESSQRYTLTSYIQYVRNFEYKNLFAGNLNNGKKILDYINIQKV